MMGTGPWSAHSRSVTYRAIKTGAGLVMRQVNFPKAASKLVRQDIRPYLKAAGSKGIQHQWDYPLYALVRAQWPMVVVETGVLCGASSTAILRGLQDNMNTFSGGEGRLFSIDLPTHGSGKINQDGRFDGAGLENGQTPGCDIPEDLRSLWSLTLGDSMVVLPRLLDSIGPIDFFYHDSDHSYSVQMFEYEQAWAHLRGGGLLVSDDIDWTPAFKDFCEKVGRKPVRWFLDRKGVIEK